MTQYSNIYQYKDNFANIKDVEAECISGNIADIPNPHISIIITVYKRRDYLCEAINSALNQKNIDFSYEILVICDDPQSELHEANDYKKIKNVFFYRNTQNLGLYNSVNLAAKIARGSYIALLHDDDLLYPNYLQEINNFLHLKQNAKCILVNRDVAGNLTRKAIYKSIIKNVVKVCMFPLYAARFLFRKKYKLITLQEGLTYLLYNIYKAPSCGTLFEKNAFMESGGFNQDFWPVSDYFYFLKFNNNYPIYMLRKKLACYRWLENLSQNKSIQYATFEHLAKFFRSRQPIRFINWYYSFFRTEVVYSKYLILGERSINNEIVDKFPELKRFNIIKWNIFKIYNKIFKFFHDLV